MISRSLRLQMAKTSWSKVQAASYCHTDAVFASGSMWQDLPRVGSHEFAGVIEALGPNVDAELGLKEGMVVGVPGR